MKMSGCCLCGSLRYTADAEPAMVCVCHCKDCQRQSGTAFGTFVIIPKADLRITGASKDYVWRGGSGETMSRRFCPDCGSAVAIDAAVIPDMILLAAGTLDDTSFVRPSRNIFCASAQAWVPITQGTENFREGPS